MTLTEKMIMRLLSATTLSLCLVASAAAQAQSDRCTPQDEAIPVALCQSSTVISIARSGSQPSAKGPAEYFAGNVRIDAPFQGSSPARVSGGTVTFVPGARSDWHTHPLGQALIVTAGVGLVQQWGSPTQDMKSGDVVWIPPGVKHWHGASPATGMTHIAVNEILDGKAVDWMENVNDEQYRTN
jgi:quercetin dioxygenase-like cupin family protein